MLSLTRPLNLYIPNSHPLHIYPTPLPPGLYHPRLSTTADLSPFPNSNSFSCTTPLSRLQSVVRRESDATVGTVSCIDADRPSPCSVRVIWLWPIHNSCVPPLVAPDHGSPSVMVGWLVRQDDRGTPSRRWVQVASLANVDVTMLAFGLADRIWMPYPRHCDLWLRLVKYFMNQPMKHVNS